MSETLIVFRAARRIFAGATATTGLVLVAILLAPKSSQFAATDRFALTCSVLGIGLAALAGGAFAFRRYRDAFLLHRYSTGTEAMQDTVKFILHERRLARRWRVALASTAWSCMAGSILSRWPQLQPLATFGGTFEFASGLALTLLALQPLYVRANIVNGRYLWRYLRQQACHVGFASLKERKAAAARQLTSAKESRFEAGDFTWELDDFYKNALVLGMSGAGKTVTVLNALTEGLIAAKANGLKTAGIIFDPKGSLFDPGRGVDHITPLCERLGRAEDLMIFSPDTWPTDSRTNRSPAWNLLDSDAEPADVASIVVTAQHLAGGVVEQQSFFSDSSRIHIRHNFALWRAALDPEPVSFTDIHRLCRESAEDQETYRWLVEGLLRRYGEGDVPADVENAFAYFEREWLPMPDRQRAGVVGTVTQLIDDFSSMPFAEMISGRSTMRLGEMIDSGKILYVHLPVAHRERLSPLLSSMIKLDYQREILRRVDKERPSFMIADEFQSIWVGGQKKSQGDSGFFERSRESRHANIVAAQNLSSFFKKTENKAEVTNFVGLCAVKIFLRNDELDTNRFASDLFNERNEVCVSMSESAKGVGGLARNQTNYSRSIRSTRVVPLGRFTRLAIPQKGNSRYQHAESIVRLGSRDTSLPLELNWPVHELKP
ncbi:hypothetical protein QWJ07_24485 [Frankia sp. RB7]|nr:hypothetical protein [Frankia sp. RB7]